jgi:elongation factor P
MSNVKGGNLKKGMFIRFKNEPFEVTKAEFYAPGKGSAICRAKLKSVKTSNTQEFTFKSNEDVEELDVMAREMQFSYLDGDDVVFMDPRTYDQVTVSRALFADTVGYLIPELLMYLVFLDEKVIGVRFPMKVTLKVTKAEEAVAGDTVNAPKKPAIVETGAEVMVPLFIKVGESIIVDTTTGEYVGRSTV